MSALVTVEIPRGKSGMCRLSEKKKKEKKMFPPSQKDSLSQCEPIYPPAVLKLHTEEAKYSLRTSASSIII